MNNDSAEDKSSAGGGRFAPAPPPPGAPTPKQPVTPAPDRADAPAGDSAVEEAAPPSIQPRTPRTAERPAFPAPAGSEARQAEPEAADEVDAHDDLDDDEEEYSARKIRLSVARIDTWSTLKLSFLLSVAIGIGIIVAAACIWLMLDGMAVFTKIDDLVQSVAGDEAQIEILQFFEFNKIISLATIIAVVDVIVITLIATLGSVIYNIVSSLIGGLKITLTDE